MIDTLTKDQYMFCVILILNNKNTCFVIRKWAIQVEVCKKQGHIVANKNVN